MILATQEAACFDDDQDEDGILPETEIKSSHNLNASSAINQEQEPNMKVRASNLEMNKVKNP